MKLPMPLRGISTPEDSLLLVLRAGNRLLNGRQGLVTANIARPLRALHAHQMPHISRTTPPSLFTPSTVAARSIT
jgi:hypothetical protein